MLEGEISQINLVERLVELWREQFTGAIRFESDGIIKIVYFKGGDILSASTNDRADSVDEILMRAGKVSREHVKQALARRKENETLGDALLNLGFITRKELSWARRVQVVGVIRSIAAWATGSFTIVADYLPKRDEGTLFAVPQIIVELIVTEGDRQKFERVLDSGEAVFAKTPSFEDVFRKLGLNEEAEQIANQIDGIRNASEVASAAGKDSFNVYKLLHAMATLGILTRVGKAEATPEVSLDDFASAGVADAADMWSMEPEPAPAAPEPVVQSQPMFDFDEAEAVRAPTLEVPIAPIPEEPPSSARSAWDEEEEEVVAAPPPPAAPMPSWDNTPVSSAPEPEPAPKEEWGFDEAQIETAQRATSKVPLSINVPIPDSTATRRAKAKAAKRRSRFGLLIALMVVFILAAGGYYGFQWWVKQQETPTPVVVKHAPPALRRKTAPPPPTDTTTTTMAAITDSTATTTQAAAVGIQPNTTTTAAPTTTAPTTTTAPPMRVTPTPATTASAAPPPSTAPLPVVVPKAKPAPMVIGSGGAGREKYDAMARQFLANATGNFTVQIQILCEASNLDKVMRDGGANVWFVPQPIGARACYRVLWGHFATREEAQRAMAQIPAGLRDPAAAVKPVPKG